MTELSASSKSAYAQDEVQMLTLAIVLLRRRKLIIGLGIAFALLGLAMGLTSTRVYESTATFIPQASEASVSGLAAAASQLGIRIPSSGGGSWGPPIYVELLRSSALLEPITDDTLTVVEQGGRRVALMDLLNVHDPNALKRTDAGIHALEKLVTVAEIRTLGAVRLSVATPWPSVSLTLAQQLLNGVNRFNLETRKSQAAAELQFVEVQAKETESALRAAEDRLQSFLQQNRAISGSPELAFERDRLQRDVSLRQQVYVSLLQSREEARIREVRDTPVITVLEDPRLPVVGKPRNSLQKGILGGIAGVLIGVMIAFLLERVALARSAPTNAAQEFFALAREATPRLLRRSWR